VCGHGYGGCAWDLVECVFVFALLVGVCLVCGLEFWGVFGVVFVFGIVCNLLLLFIVYLSLF
jgi:hypothetical protein